MTADNMQPNSSTGSHSPSMPSQSAMRREGATIGASTRINGELQADEDLLIEGSFTGTLILRKHTLTIGSHGQVKGTAFANSVTVEGTIEGDLYASERISIRKGAQVKGNILSPRVSLEDGAVLRGSVEMDPEAIKDAIKSEFGDEDKLSSKPVDSKPTAVPSRPMPNGPEANKPDASKPDLGKKGPEAMAAAK